MSNGGRLSAPGSREPLTHDTVLIVEGRDMFGFFLGLLTELGIPDRIEVRNAGGLQDWPDFQEVCNALRGSGLPVPAVLLQPTPTPPVPRVSVMLLPDKALHTS